MRIFITPIAVALGHKNDVGLLLQKMELSELATDIINIENTDCSIYLPFEKQRACKKGIG